MNILSTNFNISFDANGSTADIRKSFLSVYDEVLHEKYNPPLILPIPDEITGDIPIAIIKSKGGHSQIVLSRNGITVGTVYDNEFSNDWEKCKNHLLEKLNHVMSIISKIPMKRLSFIGLVTQIIYDEVENASEYIFDNLMRFDSKKNIYDVSCRLTYSMEEKYYINIGIENARIYDGKPVINNNEIVSFDGKRETGNKVALTIDINDRFGFNYNENYVSEKGNSDVIVKYTDNVISNISDIVRKGAVDFDT